MLSLKLYGAIQVVIAKDDTAGTLDVQRSVGEATLALVTGFHRCYAPLWALAIELVIGAPSNKREDIVALF